MDEKIKHLADLELYKTRLALKDFRRGGVTKMQAGFEIAKCHGAVSVLALLASECDLDVDLHPILEAIERVFSALSEVA